MLLFLKDFFIFLTWASTDFLSAFLSKITAIVQPGEDDPAKNHLGMPSSMIASRSNRKSMTLPNA